MLQGPLNPVLKPEHKLRHDVFSTPKHPGSICVANYKGGVGKTTVTCLLGYYLAELTGKRVLLFDIDPQCSLSLALGFDPEAVSKTELTIYNLVRPTKWTKIRKTNFSQYVTKVPDSLAPDKLSIIKGSFDVEELDMEIAASVSGQNARRVDELFLYCKQMMDAFDTFDYIIVDCPPNKMFLTQAMLQACSFYLPVTIPDVISSYGMPRLLRWVKKIPVADRPLFLGYVLNVINRTGGPPGGKVTSQQSAHARLDRSIQLDLEQIEKDVIRGKPTIGVIPRLDAIARFLGEQGAKFSRYEFSRHTSGQPSIEECLTAITKETIKRMDTYHAQTSHRPSPGSKPA
jgi:cellulose biosynthesis protein BcsQ